MLAGQIEEGFYDGEIAKFYWRIPNYSTHGNGDLVSPSVKCFHVIWRARMRTSHYYRLCLLRKSPESINLGPVRCSMGYKKADGSEKDIVRNREVPENGIGMSWPICPFSYVTTSDELIFVFTLWTDDSTHEEVVSRITQGQGASCSGGRVDGRPSKGVSRATQTTDAPCANCRIHEDHSKDTSILLDHLRDLHFSGDHHDFLLKVKDKQFKAHKCVLRARSPIFAAMFRSQMTECAEDSVTIDDCDPDSFCKFLRYVYTGKVDISSTSHALGLYYAAEKYGFPRLKELSVQFLKNSLTTTRISDVINLAVRYSEGELLTQALAFLAAHFEEVFLTVEWQRFLTANPLQANEMTIKALQCVKKA